MRSCEEYMIQSEALSLRTIGSGNVGDVVERVVEVRFHRVQAEQRLAHLAQFVLFHLKVDGGMYVN